MMIRDKIKNLIQEIIKTKIDFAVETPEEKSHGDYATNVALILAGKLRKKSLKGPSPSGYRPMEIAEQIKSKIKSDLFEKIEVAGPGFINFFLKSEFLQEQVKEILSKKEKFGEINIGKSKKVQVEFISANPTGPLHLGHGRGAFFGDTLSNVLAKAGYEVEREYYVNDARKSTQIQELGKTALGRGESYLTDYLKSKIKKLSLKNIKDEGEAGQKLAREVHKDIQSFIEKKLKIKYDKWFFEESLYKNKEIDKIYQWLKKNNLIYKKEGAEWLKTSKYGDNKDWVIVRATGEPTYLLSDTAYHKDKFNRGYDKVINVWGADHQGHVKKMNAVAKILDYKGDLELLVVQMVRLKEAGKGVKMSKRAGVLVELEWLVNQVGLDVTRFMFLMKSIDTQMEFDLALAEEKSQKNPVYYVQYAHARICSILRRSQITNIKLQTNFKSQILNLLNHSSELELIKELIKLPEIIEDTARDYQTQRLPNYAVNLATVFHKFYTDCQVLGENKDLEKARLALILATKTVLKNTMDLMGTAAPEKM